MMKYRLSWLYFLTILVTFLWECSWAHLPDEKITKSVDYLSPEFVLTPGSVSNKFYYNIDFPRGHIGIKNFRAEVVDESGVSVPLHETYLHHWVVIRYYIRVGAEELNRNLNPNESDFIWVRNSGPCSDLGQYFGLGSETRKTHTHVPDPYAIEVGNPDEIPVGYEERWILNVHAIDTRGAVDRLGCTECRCSLYNVTEDEYGRPLRPDYEGGLYCCYDKTQCQVKKGFALLPRRLYLKYTVTWVDWKKSMLPVSIYIFDITDIWTKSKGFTGKHQCQIEYKVEACESSAALGSPCIDSKRNSFNMPRGGYLIYGVAHQHSGGRGSALYRKDGKVICSSMPLYGKGKEAGNENGYIVGMSACYPRSGSVRLSYGETLLLESNYSSSQRHTGVMGLFYILVADQMPKQSPFMALGVSPLSSSD